MQSVARSTMSMIARRSTPMLRQAMMTSRPSMSNSAAILLRTRYNQQMQRAFVSPSFVAMMPSAADIDKSVQNITDLFMIARDELEYAEEARGSVYYNDDKETARSAVQECLDTYDVLLKDCSQDQKLDIQRKIGLKIMELKSQLDALNAEELE
ncbi:hypothetical protein CPB97_000211 [Podila verticillata]|nr:hypothetical protein CPB97_000211 [Podila verticillata]